MNMVGVMADDFVDKRRRLCHYIMHNAPEEVVDEWLGQEQRILDSMPPEHTPEPTTHEDAVLKFIQPWMTYVYYNYTTAELLQAVRSLRGASV